MLDFERPQPELGTEGDVVFARIIAYVIDTILFIVVFAILGAILGSISQTLAGIVGPLAGLLTILYFIYFEAEYGQTIGKMAMDVVVVTEDGNAIGYREAVIRTLLRIIDALPFLYLIGIILILVTDRKQRLGDILGDTVVVRARETESI